jgi:BlaI family transcriptional regulator, penicillinase repressor
MASPVVGKLELKIMQALWERGACSVREIQESFPPKKRPAYTTVQTVVTRLEAKGAVRRSKKISNAHIFEATLSRAATHGRFIDDLLALFGGRSQPVVAHLIESGKLTLQDIKDAEKLIQAMANQEKSK